MFSSLRSDTKNWKEYSISFLKKFNKAKLFYSLDIPYNPIIHSYVLIYVIN